LPIGFHRQASSARFEQFARMAVFGGQLAVLWPTTASLRAP
jgi:hypothetical protein